ncbi:MAG: endonuclease/exonuclease/phosphatase family protein [Bacteroidetes bacterium]|nr:endonuclease/exonuclease/phosphatase family protein [Bacteroidota bacterium]
MSVRQSISGVTSIIIWSLAILLLICLGAAYLNPSILPFTGLITLLTPFLILLNILALFYGIFRGKMAGWVTFIVLILSIPQIGNFWAFSALNSHKDVKADFSLMTYNVRNFDLYNWSRNDDSRERIFNMLSQSNPDVICFQEFYSKPASQWDNIQKIKAELELNHYYFTRELVLNEGRQWGIATFSRFPITGYGELMQSPKPNSRGNRPHRGVYTDIAINSDTIRIINIHLASIYLGREDYSTLEHITGPNDQTIKKSRSIVIKLLKAYKKRGVQVRQLAKFLKEAEQPYPIIICGDMNDLPSSYAYNKLSKGFDDAFLNTGWGMGATYNGPIPGLRIDCALVDRSMEVTESKIINLRISDHLPLLTKIKTRAGK